jgi:hypothetical protein
MFTLRFLLIALVAPLSSVLCAQAATNATSNPTNSGNGTFTSCGDVTCAPKLIAQAGCKDEDDAACICNQDFHFQINMMKCLYNTGCPNDLATFGFAVYAFGCEQLGNGDNSTTATPTQLAVPTGTPSPAATFSLPSCGMSCINKSTFSNCTDSLAPSCVCDSVNGKDSDTFGTTTKCILDSCSDDTSAAASLFQFERDCTGSAFDQVVGQQKAFPFNKFVEATKVASNNSSGSTDANAQGPSKDQKQNGAINLGISGLSTMLAVMLAFGLVA